MEARELRIGNWLTGTGGGRPFKAIADTIKHIDGGNLNMTDPDNPLYIPIPLTPEILEKAGFVMKVSKDGLSYELGIFKLFTFNDKWYVSVIEGYSFETCQYLHQLQNLYYCLTQNELQITL